MDDPATSGATEGFGLMFYNARWYDPALGRFAQADSMIPEQTQGTQAWDHYAYVNNNPVNASDPTGHLCEDEDANGHCPGYVPPSVPTSRPPAPTSTPDPSVIVAVPAPVVAPPVPAYTEDIGVTNIFPNSYHYTFPMTISLGPSNAYSSGAPVTIGTDELDLELPFNISLNGPAGFKLTEETSGFNMQSL
jgi:RHS repeat-associated protein